MATKKTAATATTPPLFGRTSRYQLYLPTVEELENELRRELRFLSPPTARAAPKTRKRKGQP